MYKTFSDFDMDELIEEAKDKKEEKIEKTENVNENRIHNYKQSLVHCGDGGAQHGDIFIIYVRHLPLDIKTNTGHCFTITFSRSILINQGHNSITEIDMQIQ